MGNKAIFLGLTAAAGAMIATGQARATQGIVCKSASLELALGSGTFPGATWWAREKVDGTWMERTVGQHWIDDERLLVELVDADALRVEARIEAARERAGWQGSVTLGERTEAVSCRID